MVEKSSQEALPQSEHPEGSSERNPVEECTRQPAEMTSSKDQHTAAHIKSQRAQLQFERKKQAREIKDLETMLIQQVEESLLNASAELHRQTTERLDVEIAKFNTKIEEKLKEDLAQQYKLSPSHQLQELKVEVDKLVNDGNEFFAKLTDVKREQHSLNNELILQIQKLMEDQKELNTVFDSDRTLQKNQIESEFKSRFREMEKLSSSCKQLEETVEGLETLMAVLTESFNVQTSEEQFESLLKSERKALRDLVSIEGVARANENHELRKLMESVNKRINEESSNREKQISDMSHRLLMGHNELNHLIGEHQRLHMESYRQFESRLESESKKCSAESNRRIGAAAAQSNKEFSKLWSKVGAQH